MIEIYTDGSARGNPGPGGYGVILKSGKHYKELSNGFRHTTNNRMELLAAIVGLEAIKKEGQEVVVTSDSRYVTEAINQKWVFGWEKKNYAKKKNPDLWKRLMIVFRKHKVRFIWVKGHNDHPMNERCDELAVEASHFSTLQIDEVYERESKAPPSLFKDK